MEKYKGVSRALSELEGTFEKLGYLERKLNIIIVLTGIMCIESVIILISVLRDYAF